MSATHDVDRAVIRSVFWDGFWEAFASPFAILFDWFAPQDYEDEISNSYYLDRYRRRYGGQSNYMKSEERHGARFRRHRDRDVDLLVLAWRDVAKDFWCAFEQLEREYGPQIHAVTQERLKRNANGSASKL